MDDQEKLRRQMASLRETCIRVIDDIISVEDVEMLEAIMEALVDTKRGVPERIVGYRRTGFNADES